MTTRHSAKHTRQQEHDQDQDHQLKRRCFERGSFSDEQGSSVDFLGLPDDVLVHIGKSVAKLCGTRDYFYLSLASKRMKCLLLDSAKVLSEVIIDFS